MNDTEEMHADYKSAVALLEQFRILEMLVNYL